MRNYFLITLLIVVGINCKSQDLIKKNITNEAGLKESYKVLKSDKKTKHGEYSSIWVRDTVQKGYYTMGKKTGVWRYFSSDSIDFIYNFDTDKVLTDKIGKERNALYSEGDLYYKYLIWVYITYPDEAKEANAQGKVIIEFTVDTDGIAKDFKLKLGCGNPLLNKEGYRVIQKAALENKWYPAINEKGEKTKSTIEKPVTFQLK
jgi:TonB family protein